MKYKERLTVKKLHYTGIFFPGNKHMTWNYGFPLVYPKNDNQNKLSKVMVIGEYEDKDVACFIVTYGKHTHQPIGRILHITTKYKNGVKPVISGIRAMENGWEKIDKPYQLEGIWK